MAGRPESPLDPSEGPVVRFAAELRRLRAAAGSPSYRVMAQRTGQGASTLSQAAAGERLPTLTVVLAYVKACDGDVAEWEERWRQAAEEAAATGDRDDDAAAPYRGLARFEPGDRDLFFGRDALVDQLAAHMRTHRLVAVVGASGSGKSSLLRAGLIPALQTHAAPARRPAALRILTPGPHPLATHAGVMAPREAAEGDTVVVVDQFEELYTLCQDPVERSAFVDLLVTAVRPDSRLRVVIAVRADFFGRCAEHHHLAEALRQATLLVGPMSPAELREAIVKPAAVAGLIVERELTAQIIGDVADEPGGLPLLSHALLETWRRRKGRALTVEMYAATGGIHGAIAKSAEQVYSTFSDAEEEAARRILLRLITPGDGVPDTRRPTNSAELDNGSPEARHVLSQLVRTRLLTLDGDTVDLAHEALITAWPRYRAWVEEDRERLRLHRKLTEAAQTWDELTRDPGALYRGSRLAAVLDVFGPALHPDLTGVEDAFLTASIAARDDDEKAAARTTRRLRSLTAALSVLLVLALAASVTAWTQSRVSEQQRQAADAARQVALSRQLAAQSTGLMGTDPDLGSLLAVQAYRTSPTTEATTSLYTADASPLKRRLTGHSAWVPSLAFSPDGHILATASDDHTVRLWDAATGRTRNILVGHQASVASLAFSPDGHILATASDDRTVRLWDVATGHPMRRWNTAGRGPGERGTNGHPDSMVSVVFSPDGHTVATTSDGRTVSLREVATGRTRPILTAPDVTASVAFSPDGRTVVTTSEQGTVRLWDVATGQLRSTFPEISDGGGPVAFSPDAHTFAIGSSVDGTVVLRDVATGHSRATLTGHTDSVRAVAFSPDGRVVATASDDRTVRLWDAATGRTRLILPGRTDWMVSLAFSPDGNTLATGSYDGTVRLWDVGTRRPRATLGHTGIVMSTAFSPDGHTLATGSYDGTVHLWDAATGRSRVAFANHDDAALVAFSPDGHTLATASGRGTLRRWGVATGHAQTVLTGREGVTTSVGFSPDGRTLVTADLSQDRPSKSWQLSEIVRLWDVATGRPRTSTSLSLADGAATAAFSPDGHTLAISGHDGTVRIWDMTTRRARTVPTNGSAGALAYSPDGSTLAIASSGNTVKLWNTATSQLQTTLTGHQDTVTSVAFSPDGHTLATGSNDGTVRLWNTATGQTQASLTTPTSVGPVTFSPDGHTLATTSANPDHSGDTVRLWHIAPLDQSGAIKKICRAVDRDLTVRERSVYLPGQPSTPVCPP